MNNSFVSNVNENMTVRGYVTDENELVLLEPEGSGGGGAVDAVMVNAVTVNDYNLQLDITIEQSVNYIESGKVIMFTIPSDFGGALATGAKYGIVFAGAEDNIFEAHLVAMQTATTYWYAETYHDYTAVTDPTVLEFGE